MTDHADTIRRLPQLLKLAYQAMQNDPEGPSGELVRAFESLRAERQQAIDERDAQIQATASALEAGRSLNREKADLRSELKCAEDESALAYMEAAEARIRCEQAIDALREIADHVPGRFVMQSPDYVQLRERARAALLNLGEQPQ